MLAYAPRPQRRRLNPPALALIIGIHALAIVAIFLRGWSPNSVLPLVAGYNFVGVALSYGMLAAARPAAPLVRGDALPLPRPSGGADGVPCGFALRNLGELPPFFVELARILRPGGRIALLEVATPPNRILRWGHSIYFGRVVPLIGRLVSDGAAYRYLPRSVAYLPEPEAMLHLVKAAGFTAVERRLLTGGVAQLVTATRTSVAA